MESRPIVTMASLKAESIAVVVPCYGHAAFVPRMLESLAAQTRPPDELVFIDDGSPDGTAAVIGAFVAREECSVRPALVLRNERNLGQSASLNLAIAATSSDLVMVLNDDDYLMHDAIEAALELFRAFPEAALVGANHVRFAGDRALADAEKLSSLHTDPGVPPQVHLPRDAAGYRYADDLAMTHSGMCFRRAAWELVGGYRVDPRERVVVFSDRDFQMRVNAVWPVVTALGTSFAFWRTDSSVDGRRNS
jgi:glycosyltransferase involved in cell wall biosynthesis